MDHIQEFVDQRQKALCIHCGTTLGTVAITRDHVPSKSLLKKPYPANLPIVEICAACNGGFSLDEEYMVAFLGSVIAGSTDPDDPCNHAAGILARNSNLRSRLERGKTEYTTVAGEIRVAWKPELERINRVIVKDARGHAFFEYGEPMLDEPRHVASMPLVALTTEERDTFDDAGIGPVCPEVGSRMLSRLFGGRDLSNGWIIVQEGVYRYSVSQFNGITAQSVLFEYLATGVCWTD